MLMVFVCFRLRSIVSLKVHDASPKLYRSLVVGFDFAMLIRLSPEAAWFEWPEPASAGFAVDVWYDNTPRRLQVCLIPDQFRGVDCYAAWGILFSV